MVGPLTPNVSRLRPVGDTEAPRAKAEGAVRATPAAAGPVHADSVALSGGPRALPEGMLKGPPVDAALVERLGSAIAEGRYPVDPERIAAALCRDCLDLPS